MKHFAGNQGAVSVTFDPFEGAPPRLVETGPGKTGGAGEPSSDAQIDQTVFVELLREGLTFDCIGLAPGPASEFPLIEHRFDCEAIPTAVRHEALHLAPGPHLGGGARTMPVVKGLIAVARDILHHFETIEAVVWPASRAAIGRRFFESISTAWLEGGAFPALGLTAFKTTMDGALQSVGLDFWIGQELRIEPPLSQDKIAATRLGVRLVNQLVILGGLDESERIVGPDGSRLVMRPSRNRKFVRVWRE